MWQDAIKELVHHNNCIVVEWYNTVYIRLGVFI